MVKRRQVGEVKQTPQRRRGSRRWMIAAGVLLLCAAHFILAITSVRHKSNTYDEIAHLTRGFSYRMTGDYRLGPPHPPLAHYWATLPADLSRIKFPSLLLKEDNLRDWHRSDVWEVGRQFFYYKNVGNAAMIDGLLLKGRAMIAVWSMALGALVFGWARHLFGTVGGFFALTLYAVSPTMLAHGRLVTTDCAAALFFMCSLTAVWWLLHQVSPVSVLAGAAALACLFLSKMSAALIIPVGLLLLALRIADGRALPVSFGRRRRALRSRPAQLACFTMVMIVWIFLVWLGIWGAYGFRYEAMVGAVPGRDEFFSNSTVPKGKTFWEHVLRGEEISPTFKRTIPWLREHHVFPEAYTYSAAYARQTARGRISFLNGETNIKGFHSFFPYTFLYKTPLPLFGILLASAAVPLLRRWMKQADAVQADRVGTSRPVGRFMYDSAPLWIFFVVYWIVSVRSDLNIGHRHILPTYPALFVACGAISSYWSARARFLRAIPATLIGLFALASLRSYPHYLAYFNLIAGGPDSGYHHLVDSSLDWGQDLPGLKSYLDGRRDDGFSGDVYLSYFGSGGLRAVRHFGIDAVAIPYVLRENDAGAYRYGPGLYAISATNLQQLYTDLDDRVWTATLEMRYRQLLQEFESFDEPAGAAEARAKRADRSFRSSFDDFHRLRFARLCAFLRPRRPDFIVNHTILIFDLDAKELDAALHGPVSVSPAGP